jgi:hypothetical protein
VHSLEAKLRGSNLYYSSLAPQSQVRQARIEERHCEERSNLYTSLSFTFLLQKSKQKGSTKTNAPQFLWGYTPAYGLTRIIAWKHKAHILKNVIARSAKP